MEISLCEDKNGKLENMKYDDYVLWALNPYLIQMLGYMLNVMISIGCAIKLKSDVNVW